MKHKFMDMQVGFALTLCVAFAGHVVALSSAIKDAAQPLHWNDRTACKTPCDKTSNKHVVVTVMKDESSFVVEWINYHLFIGFSHFYIYNQDDDKKIMEDALKSYVDKQVVTLIPWNKVGDQKGCYKHFMATSDDITTFTFIDGDEFLVLCEHATVDDFARSVGLIGEGGDTTECIELAWFMFGTSGLPFHPPKTSVMTMYYHREACPVTNHPGKVMVKWRRHLDVELSNGRRELPVHHFCAALTTNSVKSSTFAASIYHYSLRGGRSSFAHRLKRGASGDFAGQLIYNDPNGTLMHSMESSRNEIEDTTMLTIHDFIPNLLSNDTLPCTRKSVNPICEPRKVGACTNF